MADSKTLEAAQITFAYIIVYFLCISVQVYIKIKSTVTAAKKKEGLQGYKRYEDPTCLVADRIVGNTLEWMPVFLGLFWLNYLVGQGVQSVAWVYVVCRLVYPFLAVRGGITKAGAQPLILLSTIPAYFVLFYYGYHVGRSVIKL